MIECKNTSFTFYKYFVSSSMILQKIIYVSRDIDFTYSIKQ